MKEQIIKLFQDSITSENTNHQHVAILNLFPDRKFGKFVANKSPQEYYITVDSIIVGCIEHLRGTNNYKYPKLTAEQAADLIIQLSEMNLNEETDW